MYELQQDDLIMMQNKTYPLLLGSITRNTVVSLTDVARFNLFLDENNIKRKLGSKGERVMQAVLSISQGMKNNFGENLRVITEQDWHARLKENLPYPEKDILICNLPETHISRKLERGEPLSGMENRIRREESQNDVFIFAGFVAPGKH